MSMMSLFGPIRRLLRIGRATTAADLPEVIGDPWVVAHGWLKEAEALPLAMPWAAALATVTPEGQPRVRFVLPKALDERGLSFYTHDSSAKGRELAGNPRAAVAMYWDTLARQLRLEGAVEFLPAAECDAYFATRPRKSQLGAWASRQSEPSDAVAHAARLAEAETRFKDKPVTRPPGWRGYLVVPHRFEFWQGKAFRLHDRVAVTRQADGSWRTQRLDP